MILEVQACTSGFNHDAPTARGGFSIHIYAQKARGSPPAVGSEKTVKTKNDGFFVERSHTYQSTLPLLHRETSTQRLEETQQRSYGGLEEKNRKSAAMEFYSPRPFNGPFNTASSAADTSQALHITAASAQKARRYSARPCTLPRRAQSQNKRLSEQIKINKGSDASVCKKEKRLHDPVRWR